jgi:hypothetical protein
MVNISKYINEPRHLHKASLLTIITIVFCVGLTKIINNKPTESSSKLHDKSNYTLSTKLNTTNDTQSLTDQINVIKQTYQLALSYYNKDHLSLAEKEFIKVLKPILSKSEIRTLPIDYISELKREILDSMYHIGLIYLKDKTYPNNYAKAAAIFQYCSNFARKYQVSDADPQLFLHEAYRTEKEFLHSIDSCNKDAYDSTEATEYKRMLQNLRHHVALKLDELNNIKIRDINLRAEKIEKIYKECMKFFINDKKNGLIQRILTDCIEQLGGVPKGCKYSVIALGSFAGGTATPWSDLEFAILIDNDNEQYKQYFRNLAKLFHIKIVNLGETQLRWVGIESLNNFKTANDADEWFWDDVMPYGISLDGAHWHACETPLGRKGYKATVVVDNKSGTKTQAVINKPDFELILSPSEMSKFQQEKVIDGDDQKWADTDPHLVQSLRSVALIDGSQALLDDYRSKIKKIVSPDVLHKRSIQILREDVHNLQLRPSSQDQGKPIDVKKGLYRLSDRVINGLANYYDIMARRGEKSLTEWGILDRMKKDGIISNKGAKHFKEALSISAELRLRAYYNNHDNKNKETIPTYVSLASDFDQKEQSQERALYFKNISMIQHFYQVMLRVQDLVKAFCDSNNHTQAEHALKSDILYLDDTNTVNLINQRFPLMSN